MTIRFISFAKVISVNEVVEQNNFKKHDDGSVTHDDIKTGQWSVRISDSSALIFPEKPEGIEAGKMVKITVEPLVEK
jgi:hypothetical protein